MPKSKAPRKKVSKANRLKKFIHRTTDRKVAQQIRNFWCADGTMLPKMLVETKESSIVAPDRAIHQMLNTEQSWQVVAFVFCRTDKHNVYFKTDEKEKYGRIRDLSPEIREMCDTLIAAQNEKHFVSYAWWATPSGDVDLDVMIPELEAMFETKGAYNAEICNLNMVTRFGS